VTHSLYPDVSKELVQQRRDLAPDTMAAFRAFNHKAFADGALSAKMKDIIAVAVAHVTQCPYCIRGHTESALKKGATEAELMEASLGGCRDEGRRGVRAFADRDRHDAAGAGER